MNKPLPFLYPQAEFVVLWMQGVPVQYEDDRGEWITLGMPGQVSKMPHFYAEKKYRVKPLSNRERIALLDDGTTKVVNTLMQEHNLMRDRKFVRWITSWTYHEEFVVGKAHA